MRFNILFLAFGVELSSFANPNVSVQEIKDPHAIDQRRVSVNKADIIVDENFELFTEGSETDPCWADEDLLCGEGLGTQIDPALTHGARFEGYNVAMAGGMALIRNSLSDIKSYIATPQMDYSGTVTLSFKAKALKTEWSDPDGETRRLTGSSLNIQLGSQETEALIIDGKPNGNLASFPLYEHQGWCLITIEFNNYTAANDASIIISSTGHLLIDDLQVTASVDKFIAEPICLGITEATNDSFTLSWTPVRKSFNYYLYLYEFKGYDNLGKPIYQTVVNINNLYIDDETRAMLESTGKSLKEYFMELAEQAGKTYEEYLQGFVYNKPYNNYDEINHVAGKNVYSYTFEDLDPDKQYFFDLRSHYLYTFSEENIREASYIGTPTNLVATDITEDAFTANWTKIDKSDGYYVDLYGAEIAEEDSEDYVIFEESFNATEFLTDVTDISSPDRPQEDSDLIFDDLTSTPGWSFPEDQILLVKGKVGLNIDEEWGPYLLTTPYIYTANSEEATITLKIESILSDFDVYLSFAGQWYCVSSEGSLIEGSLTLPTNGLSETKIELFGPENAPIFIDYIEITQPLHKGDYVYWWLDRAVVPGCNMLNHRFSGLDSFSYPLYAFTTTAYMGMGENQLLSIDNTRMVVNLVDKTTTPDSAEECSLQEDRYEVARFTIDGNKVIDPVKGLNIILYNDGSTRKELVR